MMWDRIPLRAGGGAGDGEGGGGQEAQQPEVAGAVHGGVQQVRIAHARHHARRPDLHRDTISALSAPRSVLAYIATE